MNIKNSKSKRIKKEKVKANYIFTIKRIGRKKLEKTIQIHGVFTLMEFDLQIRTAMNFDVCDHISAFYAGKPYRSPEIATITPSGDGENSNLKIDQIGLKEGFELGYVYDFGNNIQCLIILNEISHD